MARLTAALMLAALTALTSCSGCGGKKKGRGDTAGITVPTDPSPSSEPTSEPVTEVDESVGEDVPPITNDAVGVIDTENAASLKHLIFETSATVEAGRYLSEYLIVIRAKEDSCVRLKVRPTAGITDQVDEDSIKEGVQGKDACSGQTASGEVSPTESPSPSPTASPSEGAGLRNAEANFVWMTKASKKARGFQLASQTSAVCAPRLFRMESAGIADEETLEPVTSKLGLLRAVGQKVRIWLDEEYNETCSSTGAGQLVSPLMPFGPLIQEGTVDQTYRDALYQDHLQNLANELDKIVTQMTGSFGDISDIDDSGYVEVFISPDVNRKYFDGMETHSIDHFAAGLIYKPQDLAYYDATTNPTSNEGEILYLWAPDPAGIYNTTEFPSANSLTSNYAKGYAASQAMTLIFANQRLLKQEQKGIPDPWLLQSISMLASAYYGGNDFSWRLAAQYLTSRPQYISLIKGPHPDLVTPAYRTMAEAEALGMRTIFGWYLHSRLCGGETVAPCASLKNLIDSTKTGVEAVEEITGFTFKEMMANFALSVGVSLVDHPQTALAYWNADPLPAGTPAKPTLLPNALEVSQGSPPRTVEAANTGGLIVSLSDEDRTIATPFPSKKMLIFQPIAADNDMEFKLADNAVAFVLVTGLIDAKTDVTAYFGKGLNVVFVPIGERDAAMRRIHVEKQSEVAHADMRPENLSSLVDSDRTYSTARVYPTLDYTVTESREVWSLGSIDNYTVNVGGTAKTVDDTDAYEIEFQPCAGKVDPELTTCLGQDHRALVQVVIRDFDKELSPMLIVTDTERTIFRGHSIYGRLTDVDKEFVELDDQIVHTLCPASSSWPNYQIVLTNGVSTLTKFGGGAHGLTDGATVYFSATDGDYAIGGTPNFPYTLNSINANQFELLDASDQPVVFASPFPSTYYLSTSSTQQCAAAGVAGHAVFDHSLTALDATAYAHNYDNFLSMGSLGYPYTTRNTQAYEDEPECTGYQCYLGVESARQHFEFAFDETLKPIQYIYVTLPRGLATLDENDKAMTTDEIGAYGAIKNRMDIGGADPNPTASPLDEAFVAECATVGGLTVDDCAVINSQRAYVESVIISYIATNLNYISCPSNNCPQALLLLQQGANTSAWLSSARFFWYDSTSSSLSTFYKPIEPFSRDSYCGGDPGTATQFGTCTIKKESALPATDIRQQLNVPLGKLDYAGGCYSKVLGTEFLACIDSISWHRETAPDDGYTFHTMDFEQATDRNVLLLPSAVSPPIRRKSYIMTRAGELIGKPERLQYVAFEVPGAGKIANIIIGSRGHSQGKYLLRARIMPP